MTRTIRNTSHSLTNPSAAQPTTPTARAQENSLIFMPLRSATAPRIGPSRAQAMVAMDAA